MLNCHLFKAYLSEQSITDTVWSRDETLPTMMSSIVNDDFMMKLPWEKSILKTTHKTHNHLIKTIVCTINWNFEFVFWRLLKRFCWSHCVNCHNLWITLKKCLISLWHWFVTAGVVWNLLQVEFQLTWPMITKVCQVPLQIGSSRIQPVY